MAGRSPLHHFIWKLERPGSETSSLSVLEADLCEAVKPWASKQTRPKYHRNERLVAGRSHRYIIVFGVSTTERPRPVQVQQQNWSFISFCCHSIFCMKSRFLAALAALYLPLASHLRKEFCTLVVFLYHLENLPNYCSAAVANIPFT